MQLTKNFLLSEFRCGCGCGQLPDPNSFEFKQLVGKLQAVRDACGFPLVIDSGFRCLKHNNKVGGVKDSSHLIGLAADIAVKDDFQRLQILKFALRNGFRRIGIYSTWIHLDRDDTKNDACWVMK